MRVMKVAGPSAAVVASLMLAPALACSPAGRLVQPRGPQAAAFVEVTNTNWFDVVVYSLRSGVRWRLGMVTSMNHETFRIPHRDLMTGSGLRLMADPIGSPDVFVSEPILVSPGDRVAFTVAPRLAQSYFAIRP